MLTIKTEQLVNITKQIFIVGTIYTCFFWCNLRNHLKLILKIRLQGHEAELNKARKAIIKFETQQTREVLAEAAGVDPSVIKKLKRGKYKIVTALVKYFLINIFKEVFDSLFCYRDDFSYNIDFIS